MDKNGENEEITGFAGAKERAEDSKMTELLSEMSLEDVKVVEEYWAVRHKYEAVFGKLDIFASAAPGPLPEKMREMAAKLEDYYRQERQEKRTLELVSA